MPLMILDSGAFSVWSKGITIDFDAYIDYCKQHPFVSYYVCLDVIPGKPNQGKTLQTSMKEQAAQKGWENYLYMIKSLPMEKVIPVFHQGEDVKWLQKYLKKGTPYIGISPANDRTTPQRKAWLQSLKPILCDAKGDPVVKTHGFAVTALSLMNFWHWHSVDSASWVKAAAYGKIMVPHKTNGIYDFSKRCVLLNVSIESPAKTKRGEHINSCSTEHQKYFKKYIEDVLQLPAGENEIKKVSDDYELQEQERWCDKRKGHKKVFTIITKGYSNDCQYRRCANVYAYRQIEKVVTTDHIYLAGATKAFYFKKIQNYLYSFIERDGKKQEMNKVQEWIEKGKK